MINPESVKKKNFIELLSKMTPEDINNLIKEKGKKPKLIKPFIKVVPGMEGEIYEY